MIELQNFLNTLHTIKESTWERLCPLFTEIKLKKGGYFLEDRQVATTIGFLEKGVIRAFYRNENGIEYNKHFFTSPCFIGGYSSLISGKSNHILQQALTDCDILVADYASFSKLYDTCQDLERLERKLAETHFVNKEEREIEIVLLDADKRYQIFQKQFATLEQLIPQYHIASYLGITPTQLSRIRKKMTSS
ncbi:Crp/Fnr family transcriptional regulator [Chryseobacterium sp. SIMBA_029]|uniref:Crp/Fnr family transcriptional regulator n=1 Tax=Chryseobacterium sp. SIMBA_029 TaxID=3085772 RepID=UPI00397826BA